MHMDVRSHRSSTQEKSGQPPNFSKGKFANVSERTELEVDRRPLTKVTDAAALLGSLGGKKGGRARAEALTERQRKKIARKGGKARAKNMTPEERSESAPKAARARWE